MREVLTDAAEARLEQRAMHVAEESSVRNTPGVRGTPGPGDASSQASTIEVSILDIVLLLFRNRRRLIIATVACTVAAALLAFLLPPRYTAVTSILPPQQSSSFSSSLLSQLGGLGSLAGVSGIGGLKSPTDLYVGLLKSETVEDSMIRRFDLQKEYKQDKLSNARKQLESHVAIDGSAKDGLIRISVQSYSPDRAAELANGYVDQYRKLSESLAIGEASQRRRFLEQQLLQAKNNLATAEEELKKTEQASGLIQLDSQARALIESAGSLRAQIAAKEVEVQSMRTYAGAGNVDLLQAQEELSGLRSQLEKLGGTDNGSDLILSKGKIPQAGLEYVRKVRDVKYGETIFEILARQYEAARLDEAREGSMVQVVDVASPPDRKSWPPRLLFIVGGAVLGFFGASAFILGSRALRYIQNLPEYTARLKTS